MAASLRQVHAARPELSLAAETSEFDRRAALKGALADSWTVLPEDEHAAVRERADQWNSSLKPWDAHEGWLVEQIALVTLRLERCQLQERAYRELLARRATNHWDTDRRAAVETLASALGRRPAEIARRLEQSKHGCLALADRWERLAHSLDAQGSWTPAQRTAALDLLGTPAPFRDAPTPADADPAGLRALIRDQLARLNQLRDSGLDDFDDLERTAAESGLAPDIDDRLGRLHRLEATLARELAAARSQLKAMKFHRPSALGPDTPRSGTWPNLGPDVPRPSPRHTGPEFPPSVESQNVIAEANDQTPLPPGEGGRRPGEGAELATFSEFEPSSAPRSPAPTPLPSIGSANSPPPDPSKSPRPRPPAGRRT